MSAEPTQLPDESVEVVQPGALEAIARADINQQIATAKQFPRSIDLKKHQGRMLQMAAYSPEAAAECFYAIPRGGLDIYGPSVRLSEIVAYVWGNLYSVSRIVDINPVSRLVTAQAVAWDLEANVKEGIEYTQRITIKGPEGSKTACLAAIAIAGRNAKLKLVPRVVWWPVYERCLAVARGDVIPLGDRLAKMVKAFAVYGITLDRILAKFGYENIIQFTDQDLPALIGYHTAIKEEASTPEEIFPRGGEPSKPSERDERSDRGDVVTDSKELDRSSAQESSPVRRRGRPPGSGRKSQSPATTSEQKTDNATHRESHQYGPNDEPANVAQFPAQEATQGELAQEEKRQEDPKKELAGKLRSLLEGANKTEGALMAKLREWGFGKNLPDQPIHLEDYGENTLTQVIERWPQLSTHVR